MKNLLPLLFLLFLRFDVTAQNQWFTTYTDSAALLADANQIADMFIADINKMQKDIPFSPKVMVNTTPLLIYYSASNNMVNLRFWEKVNPKIKAGTYQMAGSEDEGKKLFGLFFNGFYLTHELGHAFQHTTHKDGLSASYGVSCITSTKVSDYWT